MGNGETTSNTLYTKGSTNLAQIVATGMRLFNVMMAMLNEQRVYLC